MAACIVVSVAHVTAFVWYVPRNTMPASSPPLAGGDTGEEAMGTVVLGLFSLLVVVPAVIAYRRAPCATASGRLVYAIGCLTVFVVLWPIGFVIVGVLLPGALEWAADSRSRVGGGVAALTVALPFLGVWLWHSLCSWASRRAQRITLPGQVTGVVTCTPHDIAIIADGHSGPALEAILQSDGRATRCYMNPARALAHLRANRPKSIILQADAPGVCGYDLCRKIRRDRRLAAIPLVFFSSHTDIRAMTKLSRLLWTTADQCVAGPGLQLIPEALHAAESGAEPRIWTCATGANARSAGASG